MRGREDQRWLVVVRAGRGTLHRHYSANDPNRRYDVIVAAWQEGVAPPEGPNDRLILQPGQKIDGYFRLFTRYPDLLDRYSHIALVDDDLKMTPETVNRCFEEGADAGLSIWQPSLTPDSYFSYAAFLNNPAFSLRYTNFVEMMCPFFRADALKRALPLFNLGYDTGPDLIWTRLEDDNHCRAAILDTVSVHHTRPVGEVLSQRTKGRVQDYDDQIARFLDIAGLGFRGNVVYAARTRHDGKMHHRPGIALRYLRLLSYVSKTPLPKRKFLRMAGDSIRHVLSRPKNIDPIDVQTIRRRFSDNPRGPRPSPGSGPGPSGGGAGAGSGLVSLSAWLNIDQLDSQATRAAGLLTEVQWSPLYGALF